MICSNLIGRFDEPLEFRLVDINPRNLDLIEQWGATSNRQRNRKDTYLKFTNRQEGLKGADAVIITISTGGLTMMRQDQLIPEKYGIFATVGDTAGPSGWSRSIRNIPVFLEFAEDFQKICPNAFIANYTNPMSSLTAAIQAGCDNPSVGLCHSCLQTKKRIQLMFGLETDKDISIEIAGMNHFHWITRFTIKGKDGYKLLKGKIGNGSIADLMPTNDLDENGKVSIYFGTQLMTTLYETYGYLPYGGDRHTAEFLSFTLSNFPERYLKDNNKGAQYDTIKYCNIYRTTCKEREKDYALREPTILEMIEGRRELYKLPGEAEPTEDADMIKAYLLNKPCIEPANVTNVGQIPCLPKGACVETMAAIDGSGVHPCIVPDIPEYLAAIMRPQAECQKWLVEGIIKRDRKLLMQALYRDPQCACLPPQQIRNLGEELFQANKQYLDDYGIKW
jgi:alpha-galactosidase